VAQPQTSVGEYCNHFTKLYKQRKIKTLFMIL